MGLGMGNIFATEPLIRVLGKYKATGGRSWSVTSGIQGLFRYDIYRYYILDYYYFVVQVE